MEEVNEKWNQGGLTSFPINTGKFWIMSFILFSYNMVLLKNTLLLFAQLLALNELRFKIMFFLIIFWLQNSILVFFEVIIMARSTHPSDLGIRSFKLESSRRWPSSLLVRIVIRFCLFAVEWKLLFNTTLNSFGIHYVRPVMW